MCVCVRACVRAFVRALVHACVRACVCGVLTETGFCVWYEASAISFLNFIQAHVFPPIPSTEATECHWQSQSTFAKEYINRRHPFFSISGLSQMAYIQYRVEVVEPLNCQQMCKNVM